MSETRDFLKRMKEEGLIRADITCAKEHIVIHEKGGRHDSKAFQQVKTQLMSQKKIEKKTLVYILAGVFVIAILISFLDSNISGFYRSLFSFGPNNNQTTAGDNANLSTTALAALDSKGKSRELIRAVQNGDSPLVQKLLDLETDINGRDEQGNTPLVAALNSGKNDIANFLLDSGASVDTVTENGITPVMAAAENGNSLLLNQLLKNGAKTGQVDKKGNSALNYAIQSGCVACASMILKRGANPNRRDGNGRTPLLAAASSGNIEICDMLIKAGAKVRTGSPDGTTPLMKAAGTGSINLVRKLLAAGAAIDATSKSGNTALAEAAVNRHPDVVHLLFSTATEKKIRLSDAKTVLEYAVQKNNTKVAAQMILAGVRNPLPTSPVTGNNLKNWKTYRKLLRKTLGKSTNALTDKKLRKAAGAGKTNEILAALKEGADPAATNKNKENAVMLAVRNHQLSALKTLLSYGAPVEAIDLENGDSPLLIAAGIRDPRFAALLLQAGANPNKPGLDGYTAMDLAFASGNRLVIAVLARSGAQAATEWNKNQWTPLEFVIVSGKTDMLDMLIRNAADIDKTDANGWSALHYAIMLGKPALVNKILKKGADINLRDKKEWTPLHFAVLAGRLDILKNLISNGAKVNRKNNANWPPLYLAIALRHPDMTRILLKAGSRTRYKSSAKVKLPPLNFPKGSRADSIAAALLRQNPRDLIAKEIQKEVK